MVLANLANFDRKIARIGYENSILKGETIKCPRKCPENHPVEVKNEYNEIIKCKKSVNLIVGY